MPDTYVPPHLRNQSGVIDPQNNARPRQSSFQSSRSAANTSSSKFSSYGNLNPNSRPFQPRSNNFPGSYGNSGSSGRYMNQNQNPNSSYAFQQRYPAYNQQQSQYSNSYDVQSTQSQKKFEPGEVVSYVAQNPPSQSQPHNQNEGYQNGGSFSKWDVRADRGSAGPSRGNYRGFGGSTLTELGFHGSTVEVAEEVAELFGNQLLTGINFDKYDDIPVETSGHDIPEPINYFNEVNLPPRLLRNLGLAAFTKPTPVQKYAVPVGLAGRDLMACAQTGSGKTGGFLFPIIAHLLSNGALVPSQASRGGPSRYSNFPSSASTPNALILAPTRELSMQIHEEAQKFCYATGLRPVVVYGGASARDQSYELRKGADILVATPGRLVDFIDRGNVDLSCVQFLVLDEADRMLDMGFEPVIRQIVNEKGMRPQHAGRRTFMFSATFPREIQRLAIDFLQDHVFLTVGRVGSAAQDITQTFQLVSGGYDDGDQEKKALLVKTLSGIDSGLVVIFVETKRKAESLQYYLQRDGFPCSSIHGDRTQQEREQALALFKAGETPILVATDVASRGLDISNVTCVINYDLPSNIDDYVHRIGRTGRAGNQGTALSFFDPNRNANIASDLLTLLKENKQNIPSFLMNSYGKGSFQQQSRNFRDVRSNVKTFKGRVYQNPPRNAMARQDPVQDAW